MLSVSLNDYALSGLGGFGSSTQGDVDMLTKALESGSMTGQSFDNAGPTQSGGVLRVESLEDTLTVLTFTEAEIVLWKQIPKIPVYSTVHEYDQLLEYGQDGFSFTGEGELPQEDQATYARKTALVKFLGTTGSVSHPMQLVNVIQGVGNIMQEKVMESTMKLLRDANKAVAFADSNLIPFEFDGLYAQHFNDVSGGQLANYYGGGSDVVIDLRGKAIGDSQFQDGALSIIEHNGNPTSFFAPPAVYENYAKRLEYKQRTTPGATVTGGNVIDGIATQYGKIESIMDKFLKHKYSPKTTASMATPSGKTPAPPASVVASIDGTLTSNGMYANFTGDYGFAVTAMNRFGESIITASNILAVTGANQVVDLTITPQAGVYAPSAYNIYKTEVNLTTGTLIYHYLYSVSAAQLAAGYDGGTANVVVERNYLIPNTSKAFMLEKTKQIFNFMQLAPLMKMDLALVAPSSRFMLLLYGTDRKSVV